MKTIPLSNFSFNVISSLISSLRAAYRNTGIDNDQNGSFQRKIGASLMTLAAGVTWVVAGLTLISPVRAVDLYSTGFSNPPFVEGVNTWAGTDGWSGNDTSTGIQGITGGNQQGYLGFNPTSAATNYVWRPFNYDPVAQQNPMVDFGMDIAINDSTNGKYDNFSTQIYNSSGAILGSIYFSNSDLHIWRFDGVTFTDTGVKFTNDILQRLTFSVNFATNTWSAIHNGAPLFTSSPFHGGTGLLNFGDITYSWQVATAGSPGNNYLTVDNLTVSARTVASLPSVTNPTSSAITQNSATLGGNVTSDGGAPITERGVVYSVTTTNNNPVIGGSGVTKVTGGGTTTDIFSVLVTGLAPATAYTFKAYAINSVGTGYSDVGLFVSSPSPTAGSLDPLDLMIVDGEVRETAVQPDGKVIITGSFTSILGVSRRSVARLNANGTLDMGFNPNPNGPVWSIAVQADGKVIFGGDFTTLQPNDATSGTMRNRIARVNADGTLDSAFDPNVSNSVVLGVAIQEDGRILVAGGFTSLRPNGAATPTSRNYIARLNVDGTLDTAFDPRPSGLISCVALQPDGKILLTGNFTSLRPNGATTPTARSRLARVHPDGSLDAGFDPSPNGWGYCIAVQADGKVLLGGNFTSFQPNGAASPVPRNRFARINPNGTLDMSFHPEPNNSVYSVAVQADGKVLIAGNFDTLQPDGPASPVFRNAIARINADGTPDIAFYPKPNSGALSVAVGADGKVLLGGIFTTLQPNDTPTVTSRNRFALLTNDSVSQTLTMPDTSRVIWTRGGAGPEVHSVTFELSSDGGLSWTTLGAGSRTAGGWKIDDLSLPATGSVRARGRTSGGYYNGSSGLVEQVAAYSSVLPVTVDIVVRGNSAPITDGDLSPDPGDHTDFGNVVVAGGIVTRTFTIQNTGTGALSLTGTPKVAIAGAHAADFTVTSLPSSPVAGGTSTTFQIAFDPSALGLRTATVTISNSDLDENPHDFAIQGTGALSNNADLAALALSAGTLTPVFNSGTTAYTASVPNTTASITLTPTRAEGNATIKVNNTTVASGSASGNIALNVGANVISSVVTAQDGTTTKTYTVTVSRLGVPTVTAVSPSSGNSTGGTSVTITGTNFTGTSAVTFGGSPATGVTVVNATTITAITPSGIPGAVNVSVTSPGGTGTGTGLFTYTSPEISVSGASTLILDGDNSPRTVDNTDFGNVTATGSVSVTRPFSIENAGTGALNLTGTPRVVLGGAHAADFTVTSLPSSPVTTAGSTTFQITFNPSSTGLRTATVSIANNDGDENPYDFAIQGTGTSSSTADLTALLVSEGSLSPSFSTNTTDYSVTVSNMVMGLTVTPTKADPNATVTVNGNSPSTPVTLIAGANTITVFVTAQDGITTKIYTINVNTPPAQGQTIAATPPEIVSAWKANVGNALLIFRYDGVYFQVQDDASRPGMERGTFTWNKATSAFSATTLRDTNGESGLSHPAGVTTLSVSGNTLTYTVVGEGSFTFSRVVNTASAIVGSWFFPGDPTTVTFLADGTYYSTEEENDAPFAYDGMERGTYAWNPSTGVLTASPITDTNGDTGLIGLPPGFTATIVGNTMTVPDDVGTSVLRRITQIPTPLNVAPDFEVDKFSNYRQTSTTNPALLAFPLPPEGGDLPFFGEAYIYGTVSGTGGSLTITGQAARPFVDDGGWSIADEYSSLALLNASTAFPNGATYTFARTGGSAALTYPAGGTFPLAPKVQPIDEDDGAWSGGEYLLGQKQTLIWNAHAAYDPATLVTVLSVVDQNSGEEILYETAIQGDITSYDFSGRLTPGGSYDVQLEHIKIASSTTAGTGPFAGKLGYALYNSNTRFTMVAPDESVLEPFITQQPVSQTPAEATEVLLTVGTNGEDHTLTYQWFKGNAAIPGQTGNSLTLRNFSSAADGGTYTVVVTNAAGSNTSAPAILGNSTPTDPYETFVAGLPADQRGSNDDPDKDNIPNVLEYLLGGNPALPSSSLLPTLTKAPGSTNLVFTYRRKIAATGVTQVIEHATSLSPPWTPAVHGAGGVTIVTTPVPGDASAEQVTVSIPSTSANRFVRLKASR